MSEEREQDMAEVEEHKRTRLHDEDGAGESEVEEHKRTRLHDEDDEGESEVEEHRWRSK
jgi:hypothetical protein